MTRRGALKSTDRTRRANAIDELVRWVVTVPASCGGLLWLDRDSLVSAPLFAEHYLSPTAASEAAARFHLLEPTRSLGSVHRARLTNRGAEALLEDWAFSGLKLEGMAETLGVGVRMTHSLAWGLALPSLRLADRIRERLDIPLAAWLEPHVTLSFPEMRQ